MWLLDTFRHLFHPRRSNNHRPKVLHPESLGYFCALVLGFAGLLNQVVLSPSLGLHLGNVLGFASDITPAKVVELTNQERARLGLPGVTLNATLSQAALAKGQDMMTDQYWAHTAPDGKQPWDFIRVAGYGYQVAGENLARDFSTTTDMMGAWMASPTHRANIANQKYKEIGVAVIDGKLQGYDTTLVVQMFGTRRARPAQLGTATTVKSTNVKGVITTQPAASEAPTQPELNSVTSNSEPAEVAVGPDPAQTSSTVMGNFLVNRGELQVPPLFSPLQLSKAFFLAILMLLVMTLVYDGLVIGHQRAVRAVGNNVAHILLLLTVAFLVILFKSGAVK